MSSRSRSCSCCCRASTTTTSSARAKEADASWRKGVNASPGAAVGKAIFDADRAEEAAQGGRARHPGAPRDQPRRLPRHDRRAGHPHQPAAAPAATRRSSRAARACRRSSAATASRGLRAAPVHARGLARPSREGDEISIDGTTGTVYLGAIKTVEPDFAEEEGPTDAARLGRRVPQAGRLGQRRLPARRRARGDVWRAGHRPLPHRAHVHGAGAPAHRAGDDPRADEGGAAGRARPSCCPSSAPTSRASSAPCAIPRPARATPSSSA